MEMGLILVSTVLCDEHCASFALSAGLGLFKNFLLLCTGAQSQFFQATHTLLLNSAVSKDEIVAKNATLAIVILLTTHPLATYQPESHCVLQQVFRKMQKSASVELQILAAQSMHAIITLCCNANSEIRTIGDVYIRLCLPHLVENMLSGAEKLARREKVALSVLEEQLKTFLIMALTRPEERLSMFQLIRIPLYSPNA
jgi:hypothetical protein